MLFLDLTLSSWLQHLSGSPLSCMDSQMHHFPTLKVFLLRWPQAIFPQVPDAALDVLSSEHSYFSMNGDPNLYPLMQKPNEIGPDKALLKLPCLSVWETTSLKI